MIFWNAENAGLHEGVMVERALTRPAPFESAYLAVREREGRILADAQVKELPRFSGSGSLVQEWKLRADSLSRFQSELKKRKRIRAVLEVGCGNGWALARLSGLPGVQHLVGLDRNLEELVQAARCFHSSQFTWLYADVLGPLLNPQSFDVIFLAAAVQYFPDLTALLSRLRKLLAPGGAVFLWDSPFYRKGELASAAARTRDYYHRAGHAEMAAFYYHHSLEELMAAGAVKCGSTFGKWMNKLRGHQRSPFEMWKIE